MSAPTFETLSAELTQALSKRRGIPPRATARCTLGRDKVMVLVEYPLKEDDGKKLATRTLDWLEKRLRQQFDMTGLPVEIADLSETAEEVAVQLYLKHLNASKPFTMRSFTWKVEDGFADLFGQPGSDETEPYLSGVSSDLSTDLYVEKDLDLTSDSEESAIFAIDSATDLYADLSEGISQTAQQSDSDLLEFLVPDEAPVVASSELDLPTVDLPIASDLGDDRSLDFFDLNAEDPDPKPAANLSLESEDAVADEDPVGKESERAADELIVNASATAEVAKDIRDDSAESTEVEDSIEMTAFAEERIEDNPSSSERIEGLASEESGFENPTFASLESTGIWSESLAGEEIEPIATETEGLAFEDLALEELAFEDLTSQEVEPANAETEDLAFEDFISDVSEEIESENLTSEESELETIESEGSDLENLEFEDSTFESTESERSILESSDPENLAFEELSSKSSAFEGLSSEASTLEELLPGSSALEESEPEDLTAEDSAPEDLSSEDLTLEDPTTNTSAFEKPALEDREFVLEDLVPEELASEELIVKEAPVEESAQEIEASELDSSLADGSVVEEQPIPFEYDESEALPNVYEVAADSGDYADTDDATEAYNDSGYEGAGYEDYEDDGYEDEEYEDEEYEDEEYEDGDSVYSLSGDRTQSTVQADEDIAPVGEEEVQWQREQWAQQSRTSPWVFVGLFGFLVAGILGFVLTRPCTVGRCDRLETARIESDEALDQLQLDTSADNIEASQRKLRRSIRRLKPIPVWSTYHDEAQAAIPAYERQLNALDLVSAAQSKAYSAAVQSQDPPHSVSTWKEIAAQWREATAALAAVPDDSPVHELAQTKLTEYRASLSTILVRVETESRAEVSIRQAQQSASQATQQADIAESAEAWEAAAAGWETAVENLRQIPQGTQAYAEAQQMLPDYEQQLEEVRNQAEEERSASELLSEAKQKAAEAQRAESDSLWTLAIENWNTALLNLESVNKDTSAHSEVDALLAQYTKSWNDAGKTQEISFRFQTVEPSFFLVCGVSTVQVCTYAIREGGVRVDLFEGYDEIINQSITPPNQRAETVASEQLIAQSNQLLQQITQLSQQAQIPVVLHNSSGEFLARYRPELDGFVRQ